MRYFKSMIGGHDGAGWWRRVVIFMARAHVHWSPRKAEFILHSASLLDLELLPFPSLERLELWQPRSEPPASTYAIERCFCICLVDLDRCLSPTSSGSVSGAIGPCTCVYQGSIMSYRMLKDRPMIFPKK
jgi:hypothetical protein